jgi:hypothetical protein
MTHEEELAICSSRFPGDNRAGAMKGKSSLMDDLMGEIVKDSGLNWDVSGGVKLKFQTKFLHSQDDRSD